MLVWVPKEQKSDRADEMRWYLSIHNVLELFMKNHELSFLFHDRFQKAPTWNLQIYYFPYVHTAGDRDIFNKIQ